MRAFASAWPERQIVQEGLAQITWYQNIALLERLDDAQTRLWYARKAAANEEVGGGHIFTCHEIFFQVSSKKNFSSI